MSHPIFIQWFQSDPCSQLFQRFNLSTLCFNNSSIQPQNTQPHFAGTPATSSSSWGYTPKTAKSNSILVSAYIAMQREGGSIYHLIIGDRMVVPAEEHSYTASEDVEARLLLLRHHKTPFSKARFPTRLWFGSVGRERRHGWLISKKQWWMNETSNQTRVWLFGVYLQGGILYREMYMGGWNQKTIGHVNLTVSVGFDFFFLLIRRCWGPLVYTWNTCQFLHAFIMILFLSLILMSRFLFIGKCNYPLLIMSFAEILTLFNSFAM